MEVCSVDGCIHAVCSKGLCQSHYLRMRRHGDPMGGAGFRAPAVAVCSVELCGDPGYAKGYCQKHYDNLRRYSNAEEPPRKSTAKTLAGKLAEGTPTGLSDTECWNWTKYRSRAEYGVVWHNGKHVFAHRVAYELANGTKILEGLVVRHKCDNPPCVNPAHLETGTPADNVQDMMERGRHASQKVFS